MSPGRLARLLASAALAASAGCSALPWSNRVPPPAAEVKTRVEPTSGTKPTLDATEETSPLPPALVRPAPANSTPVPPSPPEASSTPLLDEALQRAEARQRDLVDALAADSPAAKPGPGTLVARAEPSDPPRPGPRPTPPPDPKPEPPPAPVKPPEPAKSPEETWREGVQRLRAVARDRVQEATKGAKPGAPNWAVRERLLGWLAEPDIDPDARSAAEVAQGRAVLKGLAAVLDPSPESASRASEIREAVAALEARAPLEIAELTPCRMVHGFGNIEPLEPATRKPGQSVVLYCELDGLAYEPAGPAFRSRVDGRVELIPEGSDAPAWTHPLPLVEDACRRRRRDYFIGHKFTLPDSIAPGKYRLRLTQRDLVTDHQATRETTIAILK